MRPYKSIGGLLAADILCATEEDSYLLLNAKQRDALCRLATSFYGDALTYTRIVLVKTPVDNDQSVLCRCIYPHGGEIYIGIEEDGYTHS